MSLSLRALQAVLAENTGEVFLECAVLSGGGLASPVRIVNDPVPLVRTEGTFQPLAFELLLPKDDGESLPQLSMAIDNVDQAIAATLRTITGVPTVRLEIVLASQPNTIEAGPYTLSLKRWRVNADSVSLQLAYENILDEPFPKYQFTPVNSPGLFG